MSDPVHDELVVVRCLLGERDAFRSLVERWHGPVRAFVAGHGGGSVDVDDVVQDVWERVLRGLPRLDDPARFPAWLFTIARHVVVDRHRRRGRRPRVDDGFELDDLVDDDGRADDGVIDRLLVERLLDLLPPAERDAIVLHHLGGLPVAEVAAVLEVPEGTVRSRLHRGRTRARALEAAPDDDAGPTGPSRHTDHEETTL